MYISRKDWVLVLQSLQWFRVGNLAVLNFHYRGTVDHNCKGKTSKGTQRRTIIDIERQCTISTPIWHSLLYTVRAGVSE